MPKAEAKKGPDGFYCLGDVTLWGGETGKGAWRIIYRNSREATLQALLDMNGAVKFSEIVEGPSIPWKAFDVPSYMAAIAPPSIDIAQKRLDGEQLEKTETPLEGGFKAKITLDPKRKNHPSLTTAYSGNTFFHSIQTGQKKQFFNIELSIGGDNYN